MEAGPSQPEAFQRPGATLVRRLAGDLIQTHAAFHATPRSVLPELLPLWRRLKQSLVIQTGHCGGPGKAFPGAAVAIAPPNAWVVFLVHIDDALDQVIFLCLQLLNVSSVLVLQLADVHVALHHLLQLEDALPTEELATAVAGHLPAQHVGQDDLQLSLGRRAEDPATLAPDSTHATNAT